MVGKTITDELAYSPTWRQYPHGNASEHQGAGLVPGGLPASSAKLSQALQQISALGPTAGIGPHSGELLRRLRRVRTTVGAISMDAGRYSMPDLRHRVVRA